MKAKTNFDPVIIITGEEIEGVNILIAEELIIEE